MSKLIAALLALLICVCAFASCGGEQTPDNPNTAAKTEGTVTTEAPHPKGRTADRGTHARQRAGVV